MKESFIIEGLAGEKRLGGTVEINGAKNAALKAMAASILFDAPVTLENIPDTEDVHTMIEILKKLGATVNVKSDSKTLIIDSSKIRITNIDKDLAKTMRASVVLTGPLLARFHKVTFPAPGGCVIGARPIDLFTDGYKKMGATVTINDSDCIYDMETKNPLVGTNISFEKTSVGATETLMMAAVLAEGKTTLKNCAIEPEIGNVGKWLNDCGANIKGIGTSTLEIEGTGGKLLSPKKSFVTIPDRIEAGSFLILGALCAKNLTIKNCEPKHLESAILLLKESGVPITITSKEIRIENNTKPNSTFKAFNVKTQEYPGFPTDLQAQIVTYLTQVSGESSVIETIFEGRFKYVEDLINMGANITTINPYEIVVKGPASLKQLPNPPAGGNSGLNAHDIRAGFAIVIAALVGKGKFRVNNVHLIDRGYERLEERLKALGVEIKRISAK